MNWQIFESNDSRHIVQNCYGDFLRILQRMKRKQWLSSSGQIGMSDYCRYKWSRRQEWWWWRQQWWRRWWVQWLFILFQSLYWKSKANVCLLFLISKSLSQLEIPYSWLLLMSLLSCLSTRCCICLSSHIVKLNCGVREWGIMINLYPPFSPKVGHYLLCCVKQRRCVHARIGGSALESHLQPRDVAPDLPTDSNAGRGHVLSD